MDDDDRPGARRDRFGEGVRRHEQRVVADIGEPRSGTRPHHRGGGGDERVRGNDYLIAWAHAKRGEAELQGVRSVSEADDMVRAAVCGPLPLEGRDRWTADVRAVEQARQILLLDLWPDFTGHRAQVSERDGGHLAGGQAVKIHRRACCFSRRALRRGPGRVRRACCAVAQPRQVPRAAAPAARSGRIPGPGRRPGRCSRPRRETSRW